MATDSILGLFVDPQQYMQQQSAGIDQRAAQFAQMDPMQRAQYGIYGGAARIAGGLGGMMGAEDPQMKMMSTRQQVLKSYDPNTLEGLQGAAKALRDAGDLQGSYALSQRAQEHQVKIEEKQAGRDVALQTAREKIQAQIDMARERGANQLQIAQMQIEGRQQLAQIAAALKQGQQGEKPLSLGDLKMVDAAQGQYEGAKTVKTEAQKYIDLIDNGKMKFGMTENLGSAYRTATSGANESDLNKTNFEQFVQNSVNNVLNQAKGTQAKDDAIRAEKQIMSALAKNDNKAVKVSLQELQRVMDNVSKDAEGTLRLVGQERKRDLVPQKGNTGGSNKVVKWGDL